MTECYIGLGSNLQQPLQQVEQALTELNLLASTHLQACSGWYQSRAVGPGQQPDYINGVALLQTELSADTLLAALQQIENRHHRRRDLRWGARTLDLDLLLFGDQLIDTPTLTVPHPRIAERNFVLYPLAELNPTLVIPPDQPIKTLLAASNRVGLKVLSSPRIPYNKSPDRTDNNNPPQDIGDAEHPEYAGSAGDND